MKDRTREILEFAVKDFIRVGKPITSEYLYELHNFGIKPAMIRWELNDLSENGFFFQTHPSGGRFPTNKAYQFFVNELLSSENDEQSAGSDLTDSFFENNTKVMVHRISEYLEGLSVGYDLYSHEVYGSGLNDLLSHLETNAKEELVNVVKDFEMLEERLQKKSDWWKGEELWPRVFIGESPVTKSEHLSVVVGRYFCEGRDVLLFSIGPTRMDYKKSVNLFKTFTKSRTEKQKKQK
ncbi:MAG: hypothetical protein WCO21_00290 [bacterium]|nr:hypothetical protein [Candidatus Jorgensenbacteria bacterium]